MVRGVLKGWLEVPYDAINDVVSLRKKLTFTPRQRMDVQQRPAPVPLYRVAGIIRVPQAFGRRFFPGLKIDDLTSEGEPMGEVPRLPEAYHPAVKEPEEQAKFMAQVDDAIIKHRMFLATAPTGSGKTVVGLRAAAIRGRKTAVVIHLSEIARQWVDGAQEHLGLPRDRISVMGGGASDWRDKDLVVCMIQSLSREPGRYGDEFYESFGTVIFDEVHRMGAPVFSKAAWQFPAEVRFGMSATLNSRHIGAQVYYWHLGPVKAISGQEALPMEIWPRLYDCGGYKLWGDSHGARMKCLSLDPARNRLIGKLVQKMYNAGRHIMVVAESVRHVQELMRMTTEAGVPADVIGQFTASSRGTKEVLVGDRIQVVAQSKKMTSTELVRVREDARVIFATYGMIKEGVDIPRLDAGLDATPRSNAEQLIGRIRRPHPGKRSPILWVTIVDTRCSRSLRYYRGRLEDYIKAGAEVKHGIG